MGIDEISMGANLGFMDKANWKPKWSIEKYNKDMELYETEEIDGNLLLNEGITSLLTLLIGGSETAFNNANAHIGVGDGTDVANATQTDLIGPAKTYKGMDSTYPQVDGSVVTFRSTFGPDDGNHAWREFTVSNGTSGSAKNLNRKVESALRAKANPDTWVIQLQVTIS